MLELSSTSFLKVYVVVVQSLSHVWLFATPWTAAHQASLSFAVFWNLLKLMSVQSDTIQPSHSLSSSFPLAFSLSQPQGLFQWVGSLIMWPKYWSFSISPPVNIEDWFPLGLIGLISLLSKGLSRVSPAPQFKSINFLALSLLYGPTLTSINDSWKNHSFDYMDLCWQSNVSVF